MNLQEAISFYIKEHKRIAIEDFCSVPKSCCGSVSFSKEYKKDGSHSFHIHFGAVCFEHGLDEWHRTEDHPTEQGAIDEFVKLVKDNSFSDFNINGEYRSPC